MQSSYREVLRCLLEGLQWLSAPGTKTVIVVRRRRSIWIALLLTPRRATAKARSTFRVTFAMGG